MKTVTLQTVERDLAKAKRTYPKHATPGSADAGAYAMAQRRAFRLFWTSRGIESDHAPLCKCGNGHPVLA